MPLSSSTQSHLAAVYSNLAQMLLISSAAAYLQIFSDNYLIQMLSNLGIFGVLGCLLAFSFTDEQQRPGQAKALLFGFAIFKGLSLGPLIGMTLAVNPNLLFAALSSSAIIFGSLSAAVLYSPNPATFYVTGILTSFVTISFWLSLVNLFFRSSNMYSLELYLGLSIFSLYVVYDTQVIIARANQGSKTVLRHCLDLYVDLVAIFARILILLLKKDQDKKREREKRRK